MTTRPTPHALSTANAETALRPEPMSAAPLEPRKGEVYRHYKTGDTYTVISSNAKDTNADELYDQEAVRNVAEQATSGTEPLGERICVVYTGPDGQDYIRTRDHFLEVLPDGRRRFTLIP